MSLKKIQFFTENISFTLRNKNKLRKWIQVVIGNEKKLPGSLNFVFCSDEYLHKLNVQYLNHDTLTDIITFDLSENADEMMISDDENFIVTGQNSNGMIYSTAYLMKIAYT